MPVDHNFDFEGYWAAHAAELRSHPIVVQDFQAHNMARHATVAALVGDEGLANFVGRKLNGEHAHSPADHAFQAKARQQHQAQQVDGFLYHVTTRRRLKNILTHGLKTDQTSTFGGYYANHSQSRIFLADKGGLSFWQWRVEDLAHHHGDESGLVTLRIPKEKVQGLEHDPVGTHDAGHPAYFVTTPIAPEHLQVV